MLRHIRVSSFIQNKDKVLNDHQLKNLCCLRHVFVARGSISLFPAFESHLIHRPLITGDITGGKATNNASLWCVINTAFLGVTGSNPCDKALTHYLDLVKN